MTAAALIDSLKRRGFTLAASGGRIQIEGPPGTVTPALLSQLAESKASILAVLDPPPPPPVVVCEDCRHFKPDSINPADGIGSCAAGQDGLHYPRMRRECYGFQISRPALDRLASEIHSQPESFASMVWADGLCDQPRQIRWLADRIDPAILPPATGRQNQPQGIC